MNEKLLDRKLVQGVKKRGGKALKLMDMSFTGLPDRTILMPGGRICFAEVKTTGKGLRARQKIVIPWLRALGFTVYVIDSQDDLDNLFIDLDYL